MKLIIVTALVGGLVACTGGSTPCGPEECASFCPPSDDGSEAVADVETPAPTPSGPTLTDFEKRIVSPVLDDIRAGVRPFDDEGIGVCAGKRECDRYIGTDVGELPQGDYILKAELRVPNTRDAHQWSIEVATECEVVRKTASGESRTSSTNSRSYDVAYAGEQRGYRLIPLRTIESPASGGARSCTYTITAPHPDGDKVYTGSWSTPDAG